MNLYESLMDDNPRFREADIERKEVEHYIEKIKKNNTTFERLSTVISLELRDKGYSPDTIISIKNKIKKGFNEQ